MILLDWVDSEGRTEVLVTQPDRSARAHRVVAAGVIIRPLGDICLSRARFMVGMNTVIYAGKSEE